MSVMIQATRDSECNIEGPEWYLGAAHGPEDLPQKPEAVSENLVQSHPTTAVLEGCVS